MRSVRKGVGQNVLDTAEPINKCALVVLYWEHAKLGRNDIIFRFLFTHTHTQAGETMDNTLKVNHILFTREESSPQREHGNHSTYCVMLMGGDRY